MAIHDWCGVELCKEQEGKQIFEIKMTKILLFRCHHEQRINNSINPTNCTFYVVLSLGFPHGVSAAVRPFVAKKVSCSAPERCYVLCCMCLTVDEYVSVRSVQCECGAWSESDSRYIVQL